MEIVTYAAYFYFSLNLQKNTATDVTKPDAETTTLKPSVVKENTVSRNNTQIDSSLILDDFTYDLHGTRVHEIVITVSTLEMLSFFLKSLRSWNQTNFTELLEEDKKLRQVDATGKPMAVYWESDKNEIRDHRRRFYDLFLQEAQGLESIPDSTVKPIVESHYEFGDLLNTFMPGAARNSLTDGVPDQSNTSTGISSSGRDAGMVAGIVVAVISGVIILAALIAVIIYRHYLHRNVTSMNFDNPVYRKTTEDQFTLEKNGYAPGSKLYPSTVGEEAQEPLTMPATNDFV